MSSEAPPQPVAERARRLELGKFERRVRRRPGLPGAFVCAALLIVGCNFAQNGPYNALTITGMALAALIVVTWAYVWTRRVRGGVYVFAGGFVDAAGTRLIAARWAEVEGVTVDETDYYVNSLPTGGTLHYKLSLRIPPHPHIPFGWELNTTYENVGELAGLIARRAGVRIENGNKGQGA